MEHQKTLGRVLTTELMENSINSSFIDEDFWACHYALVKKYCDLKKKVFLREKKDTSAVEEYENEIEFYLINFIMGLEKYKGLYSSERHLRYKEEYKNLLPKALPTIKNEDADDLVALAEKVLGYAIREKLTSKASGINISPSKAKQKMLDLERDRQAMSEEFLSSIEEKFGKQGRDSALAHVKEEGINAIEAMLEYYCEEADYWCDFLSNIEIARQEEEDKEWM